MLEHGSLAYLLRLPSVCVVQVEVVFIRSGDDGLCQDQGLYTFAHEGKASSRTHEACQALVCCGGPLPCSNVVFGQPHLGLVASACLFFKQRYLLHGRPQKNKLRLQDAGAAGCVC
jgi:hypothetical protein